MARRLTELEVVFGIVVADVADHRMDGVHLTARQASAFSPFAKAASRI
jgi:hypothetical protein